MTKLSGSFAGKARWQTTVSLPDSGNHEINLVEIVGAQKSTNPEWNDASLTYWGTADLVDGSGSQRGYFVNAHANGDRDSGTFEGRITASGEVTLDGTWKFTGGTGRFKGLKGSGNYKGRMVSPVEVKMEWEGEYQLEVAAATA